MTARLRPKWWQSRTPRLGVEATWQARPERLGRGGCAFFGGLLFWIQERWAQAVSKQQREEAMRNLIRSAGVAAFLLIPAGGFAAQPAGGDGASAGRLAQMCDAGSHEIAGLPVDQFQRTIQADDAQRAALDDLVKATQQAAEGIKAACPAETPLAAPGRLAAMQTIIEAMIAAVAVVRPPLEKFYGLLSDEQKEQIIAVGRNQRQGRGMLDQGCGLARSSASEWPTADIDRAVRPTQAQRASLVALQEAAAKAEDVSKSSCLVENLLTPTARLAAIGVRLDAMLQKVKTVVAPLNDFYATLDDEQKARFNAISLPQPKARSASVHRHHFVSFGYFIRRFFRRL
jgi:LTXXQ motif family protein